MKSFCPMQVIDLWFQVDQIKPKQNQLFKEHKNSPHNAHVNASLLAIKIKHR